VPRESKNDPTESGVLVYPRMPVPENRQSEPRIPRPPRLVSRRTVGIIAGGGAVVGLVLGFVLRPAIAPDSRIGKFEHAATEAQAAATAQHQRADGLQHSLDEVTAAKTDAERQRDVAKQAQAELADKAAEAEREAKAAAAEQAKLTAVLDKSSGSVSADGEEIHLQLVDKVLFKVGDDQLTDRGKAVLARVASALKEMDKQIWVQGHTDDTPIVVPPPPKKKSKGAPAPVVRFATNWELSAARALTVVHYLQDTAKIPPDRLAALAFGQYRPVSRSNKARNRRIEIVLYPHRAVIEKK